METTILFNRTRLRKRRARAAAQVAQHDFLLREAALRLCDSLDAMSYTFPRVAELGATGVLAQQLAMRPGTEHYLQCDLSPAMLQQATGMRAAVDEEWLPFAPGSLDAIVSAGGLHWVNDLPGCFKQIHTALRPDGLFMAAMPGPDTLKELRQVFAETDAARSGGITPRIAPFPDVRDAGGLLQRAGFALPVVDRDLITVSYENLFQLMGDLRGSAQSNMLQQSLQHFTSRGFFLEAAKRYADRFSDANGRITATFECVMLTAWKPAANQQQPAKRGSGQISLTQILN